MCFECCDARKACSQTLLFITNLADGAAGAGLFVYGCYLDSNKYGPPWMSGFTIALGLLMLCAALSSWACITYRWTGCCLMFSAYSCFPIALIEFVLAIALLSSKDDISNYLRKQGATQQHIDDATNPALPIALFVLFVFEIMRFYASRYVKGAVRSENLRHRLVAQEQATEQQRIDDERIAARTEKYAGLRDQYRQKYGIATERTDAVLGASGGGRLEDRSSVPATSRQLYDQL